MSNPNEEEPEPSKTAEEDISQLVEEETAQVVFSAEDEEEEQDTKVSSMNTNNGVIGVKGLCLGCIQ